MLIIKTVDEIKKMRKVGRLAGQLLEEVGGLVKAGISTQVLNDFCVTWANKRNIKHAPLHYNGFPKSICTSVNHVVCHGIPNSKKVLREGDIINIDITLLLEEYHGDTSKTFMVGKVAESTSLLVKRAEKAMWAGIEAVKKNGYLNDIGNTVSEYLNPFGYGIVRKLGGHGIGKEFHEHPFVPYYSQKKRGLKLKPGMTFTIEPMINEGSSDVTIDKYDGWTVYTADETISAQFEHTIAITEDSVVILTDPN